MKNQKAIWMIVISVVIGIAAVVLASQWVSRQATVATSEVAVAAHDIDLGTRLTPAMLKMVEWPKGNIPQGGIQDAKALDSRVVKTSLLKGEPILESKLAPIGSKGGLSSVIGDGKRAMTVRVNDVIGVAGFALPGNYVDIVVNTEDDSNKAEGKSKSISKIVLDHILVLAVAQESGRDETKPKVVNAVTLEVTPDQAEKLDLARSVGTLSLVLRNQVDTTPLKTSGANKSRMLTRTGEPEVVEPKPVDAQDESPTEKKEQRQRARPKTTDGQVELIKGVHRSTESF